MVLCLKTVYYIVVSVLWSFNFLFCVLFFFSFVGLHLIEVWIPALERACLMEEETFNWKKWKKEKVKRQRQV